MDFRLYTMSSIEFHTANVARNPENPVGRDNQTSRGQLMDFSALKGKVNGVANITVPVPGIITIGLL